MHKEVMIKWIMQWYYASSRLCISRSADTSRLITRDSLESPAFTHCPNYLIQNIIAGQSSNGVEGRRHNKPREATTTQGDRRTNSDRSRTAAQRTNENNEPREYITNQGDKRTNDTKAQEIPTKKKKRKKDWSKRVGGDRRRTKKHKSKKKRDN